MEDLVSYLQLGLGSEVGRLRSSLSLLFEKAKLVRHSGSLMRRQMKACTILEEEVRMHKRHVSFAPPVTFL